MSQKKVFIEKEADSFYYRNQFKLDNFTEDDIYFAVKRIAKGNTELLNVLEIGCSSGSRLSYINKKFGYNCYGIDPSKDAVKVASSNGVAAEVSTADKLPYSNNFFDIVIFGFCLYLCDLDDLFIISSEVNRVTKKDSWIIIKDFYNKDFKINSYSHNVKINSHKMDFSKLFLWHPDYSLKEVAITSHSDGLYTDEKDDEVALHVIRKFSNV